MRVADDANIVSIARVIKEDEDDTEEDSASAAEKEDGNSQVEIVLE